jgi:hypothetical protein
MAGVSGHSDLRQKVQKRSTLYIFYFEAIPLSPHIRGKGLGLAE